MLDVIYPDISELKLKNLSIFVCLIAMSTSANAIEWIRGKVTSIESTYLPGSMQFVLDGGSTSCPAGKVLKWQKSDLENNKMVYSTILAAMLSGKTIQLVVNDNDTNCIGQYIYILNN